MIMENKNGTNKVFQKGISEEGRYFREVFHIRKVFQSQINNQEPIICSFNFNIKGHC